ncbi:hypothetical protein ACHAXS_011098 [Conticribra weissflogii]
MSANALASTILRSTLATHVSLSAASLLYSAVGKSELPQSRQSNSTVFSNKNSTAVSNQQPLNPTTKQPRSHHAPIMTDELATAFSALPWLDQLNNILACMYVGGAHNLRGRKDNVLVQIHQNASYENPMLRHSGIEEIERFYRGRLFLNSGNDAAKSVVLECIHVEASEDSGAGLFPHPQQQLHDESKSCNDGVNSAKQNPSTLLGKIFGQATSSSSSTSPPTVEVRYILSQNFGPFLTIRSMLVVTVQVRSGCCQKLHESRSDKIKSRVGVPIATSAAASPGICAGNAANQTLVAEVVGIEERWNGVRLLQFRFVPFFGWSRRVNGIVASCFDWITTSS